MPGHRPEAGGQASLVGMARRRGRCVQPARASHIRLEVFVWVGSRATRPDWCLISTPRSNVGGPEEAGRELPIGQCVVGCLNIQSEEFSRSVSVSVFGRIRREKFVLRALLNHHVSSSRSPSLVRTIALHLRQGVQIHATTPNLLPTIPPCASRTPPARMLRKRKPT